MVRGGFGRPSLNSFLVSLDLAQRSSLHELG